MVNSARFLKTHALSTGTLGVTGFCWSGGTTNFLAATLGADMNGRASMVAAAETASVPGIKAPLMVQYAESDERINAMWPAYEAALKANGVPYEMFIYPGTQHGFHNNSTPRYNEAQAKIAWDCTIAFFKKNLDRHNPSSRPKPRVERGVVERPFSPDLAAFKSKKGRVRYARSGSGGVIPCPETTEFTHRSLLRCAVSRLELLHALFALSTSPV